MNAENNYYSRGHALLCSLVLLILVTILAINGFRDSLLESRIANTDRTRELSFQQAESVLLHSELELVDRHIGLHQSRQWLFRPVSYPVPPAYHDPDPESGQAPPPPAVSIQTISMNRSLIAGLGRSTPGQHTTTVQVNVTTFNRNGNPAVQLQSIVKKGME